MPSLKSARAISSTITNNAITIGQIHKQNSDFAMEYTWDNDIQSKVCYIYDYFHDDQPELNKHMTYEEDTKKTKIDAKFIITSYGSMDKDQVAYHLQFKPSEKIEFDEEDELYYFEKEYRKKYSTIYPTSMYIDIPDEKGVYCKWLICDFEEGNQFTKYLILPCDYRFQWISIEDGIRVKRQVWGCTRSMNSYTAGTWIDRYVNSLDDVGKVFLPLNKVTKSFGYLKENGENQRVILSAKTDHPLTWKITKIENTKPIGLIKATLDQDVFDPHKDFIEYDEEGNITAMYADYYDTELTPVNPEDLEPEERDYTHCDLKTANYSLKNKGSYKQIKAIYFNEEEEDISDIYSVIDKDWIFTIDDEDVSSSITTLLPDNKNIIKIKFNNDDYIGKILVVKCSIEDRLIGELKLEII